MSLNITASVTEETKQSGDVVAMVYHKGKLFTGAEGGKMIVYNPDLTIHKEIQAQYNTVNSMCIFNNDLVTTEKEHPVPTPIRHERHSAHNMLSQHSLLRQRRPAENLGRRLAGAEEHADRPRQRGQEAAADRRQALLRRHERKGENTAGDTKFVILTSFEGRPPLALVGNTLCYCDRPGMIIKMKANEKGHPDLGQLEGHSKIITAMATRGTLLYSGGYDNTVRIWDVPTKKLVASGTTVSNAVQSLAVGDDGAVFAGLTGGFIVKMSQQ